MGGRAPIVFTAFPFGDLGLQLLGVLLLLLALALAGGVGQSEHVWGVSERGQW